MADAREEWRREVGESWHRCVKKEDWERAYEMVLGGLMGRTEFMEWMDQQAWDRGNEEVQGESEGCWNGPYEGSEGGEAPMEESEEEGEVPKDGSSAYDFGWERLEAFLERGLGRDF